jgi:hypothetical protein
VAAATPWQAHRWRSPRLERGPRLLAHATPGDEEPAALKFLKQLQGKLPVIGLVRSCCCCCSCITRHAAPCVRLCVAAECLVP